jgi:hypothetical protein
VLTSIDYSKMTPEVRAQESNPRTDQDYALSWIRREGKGRLFYEALGHHESIYAIRPMLEHILAGTQYALGDLEADDSPSVKKERGSREPREPCEGVRSPSIASARCRSDAGHSDRGPLDGGNTRHDLARTGDRVVRPSG